MTIDEAGRDDLTLGVDLFAASFLDPTDRDDPVTGTRNVRLHGLTPRAVYDASSANDQIECQALTSLRSDRERRGARLDPRDALRDYCAV
jgi:hypothetical protein